VTKRGGHANHHRKRGRVTVVEVTHSPMAAEREETSKKEKISWPEQQA